VVTGAYELVAVAPPTEPSSAKFEVRAPQLHFDARREAAGVVARITHDSLGGERKLRLNLVGAERQVTVRGTGGEPVWTAFDVPRWATRLAVDLTMSREQWARFTDFGLTLYDAAGIRMENAPLNYAFGRVERAHGAAPRP
jgi:hypothetical protein